MTLWDELKQLNSVPDEILEKLPQADSLATVLKILNDLFAPASLAVGGPEQRTWELIGLVYQGGGRYYEALSIFKQLYYRQLIAQQATGVRCHKGTPLCWASDCYLALGYPLISLRYLMLTLVEDAITTQAQPISPLQTGVYWRLVLRGWLSDQDLNRYAAEIYRQYNSSPTDAFFPESILQISTINGSHGGQTLPKAAYLT